jgi:hypothetical protein
MISVLLCTSGAQAHGFHCVQETWIPLDTKTKVGICTQAQDLKLAQTEKSYPLLNNDVFKVQYWQGAFEKTMETTSYYRHEIYDECSDRLLQNEIVPVLSTETFNFAVKNPNLSDSVDASYKLVPMAEAEAKIAFQAAYRECKK